MTIVLPLEDAEERDTREDCDVVLKNVLMEMSQNEMLWLTAL